MGWVIDHVVHITVQVIWHLPRAICSCSLEDFQKKTLKIENSGFHDNQSSVCKHALCVQKDAYQPTSDLLCQCDASLCANVNADSAAITMPSSDPPLP